jgi:N-acetylglucosaminyldiphosphoundecaprenol N-acetyl-beta-D-mannosaminyltransferase
MTNGLTILGVPIDDVSMDETLLKIDEFIREGSFHQIATANVDYLVNAVKDRNYREVLSRCDLVVADGMPVVLASRLLGWPLRERVTGADLVPRLARLSDQKGYSLFLLGSTPEVSRKAALRLEEMGARIAGRLSPALCKLSEFNDDAILAEIEKANPDILLVAFGSPKQEMWIHRVRDRLKVPVCIGIGGSLDFLVGATQRAPGWMQRASLEWVYRLWSEPTRLARRYLNDGLGMARYFSVQLAQSIAMRRNGRALQIGVESIGSVGILTLSGMLSGPGLAELKPAASTAGRGGALVVELTDVSYLGADGIRALAGLSRDAINRGRQLFLAGVTPALTRTLKASGCEGLFRAVPSVLDGVRQASGRTLNLNLELGDGWAVCRIGGEIPVGARGTLEGICRQVIETNEFFEFNGGGVPEFDTSGLTQPARSNCRLVIVDRPPRPVKEVTV